MERSGTWVSHSRSLTCYIYAFILIDSASDADSLDTQQQTNPFLVTVVVQLCSNKERATQTFPWV